MAFKRGNGLVDFGYVPGKQAILYLGAARERKQDQQIRAPRQLLASQWHEGLDEQQQQGEYERVVEYVGVDGFHTFRELFRHVLLQ